MQSGRSEAYALEAKDEGLVGNGTTHIHWECFTDRCPDFISVNERNLSINVDGNFTSSKSASGIFILNIHSFDTVTNTTHLEAFILAIRYIAPEIPTERKIRINQPWDVWVRNKQRRGSLPYNVGK